MLHIAEGIGEELFSILDGHGVQPLLGGLALQEAEGFLAGEILPGELAHLLPEDADALRGHLALVVGPAQHHGAVLADQAGQVEVALRLAGREQVRKQGGLRLQHGWGARGGEGRRGLDLALGARGQEEEDWRRQDPAGGHGWLPQMSRWALTEPEKAPPSTL